MTREYAVKVAKALDAIDSFQMFMGEIDKLMDDGDNYILDPAFRHEFIEMMEAELVRLNKVLADL